MNIGPGIPAPSPKELATAEKDWKAQVKFALRGGFVEKVKAHVSRQSWETRLTRSLDSLKTIAADEIGRMARSVPQQERAEFQSKLLSDIDSQVSAIRKGKNEGKLGAAEFRAAIREANRQSTGLLALWQARVTRDLEPELTKKRCPEIIAGIGTDGKVQVQLLRKAPPLENLVLRGGGARGIANPPALIAMENQGLLRGLKQLVGTSAGALTATYLACGHTAQDFDRFSSALDMKALKAKPSDFDAQYPDVKMTGWQIGSHGGAALKTLDEKIHSKVVEFVRGLSENARNQLSPDESARLHAICGRPDTGTGSRMDSMVTFKDLQILNKVAPDRFRNLTLTGWNATEKKMAYFSAETMPNMPVALAARISMSAPFLFKGLDLTPDLVSRYSGKPVVPSAQKQSFRDGGIGSNIATEVLTEGKGGAELEELRTRTGVLAFDDGGKAHTDLYKGGGREPPPKWKGMLFGNPNYQSDVLNDRKKLHDAGINASVVFHGDLGLASLDASKDRVDAARGQAEWQMLRQLAMRQDQAYAVQYDTAQAAFDAMTDPERSALKDSPPPVRKTYESTYAGLKTSREDRIDAAFRFHEALHALATDWPPSR
jgi:predicted acylesterase/phospholipase RssA